MTMNSDFSDETRISELSIAADGRVFVFGTSRQLVELFVDLGLADVDWKKRQQVMVSVMESMAYGDSCDASAEQASECRRNKNRMISNE